MQDFFVIFQQYFFPLNISNFGNHFSTYFKPICNSKRHAVCRWQFEVICRLPTANQKPDKMACVNIINFARYLQQILICICAAIEMCLQMELKKILQRGDFKYLGTQYTYIHWYMHAVENIHQFKLSSHLSLET